MTLSHRGYVKYQPLTDYEAQRRGGKGKSAARIKEEDFIDRLLVANTHDTILCFSSRGRLYWMKVYQLPEASRGARGRPIVNLLPLEANERITAILPVREYEEGVNVFMATASGTVKKTALTEFSRPRSAGIIAVNLNDGDELIGVDLTSGSDEVMLFSAAGKVVRFKEDAVRAMGRTATGVRGIKLAGDDKVVSDHPTRRRRYSDRNAKRLREAYRSGRVPDQVSCDAGRYLYQSDRAQRFRCRCGTGRRLRPDHDDHGCRYSGAYPCVRDQRSGT